MSKPTHRIPTKQTPFSSTNNGGAATVGRHQRATLTTSIRKAKRGQTVARKRHMQLVGNVINNNNNTNSAGDDDGIRGKTTDNNPYSRNGQHIKDAIHYAQIIVQLCSSSPSNNTTTMNQASVIMQQLATSLDRLCELLTPDEADINPSSQQQQMNLSLGLNSDYAATNHNFMYHPPRDTAASYDSSMAGMTANAILSQFITNAGSGQDTNLAVALADSLGSIILSSHQSTHYNNNNIVSNSSNDTNNNSSLAIKAVIVLNQLAATDPPPPPPNQQQQQQTIFEESSNVVLDNTAPPRHIPTSWCHVIVNSSALSSILQQLFPRICVGTTTANNSNSNNTTLVVVNNIAICEKCVFVIGNLLGDSFMARQALLELGALSTLIACVGMGLEKVKLLLGQQQQQQQQQQQGQQQQLEVDSLVIVLQLLRNCIWSLINFIRGGDTTTVSIMTEIHRVDLAVLLSLPESIQSIIVITNNAEECIRASFDVAIETCWLIVYLTNHREAMMFGIENWLSQDILVGLGSRLCSGVDAAIIQFKQIDDDGDDDDDNLDGDQSTSPLTSNPRLVDNVTNSSIPCCRALTNIAIYLDSIPPDGEAISQAKQSVTSALLSEMTARCLAELISLGSIGVGTTASTIACSAASLASICLTDASRDYENYTGAAVWSLLPALVRGLVGPMCTYEFRREVVWSIWNTLQHNRIQHRLLMEIIGTSATEVAEALTGNLTSLISSDEVEPSLGIVDLLLRTVDDNHMRSTIGKSLKIVFEEVGLVDALWYVCDNDVDESDVAEKAAELIDDFYEEQEEEDEDDRMMPSVNGHQFQFQAPSHTGQFNFG
eukprot:scaffold943_cov159-Skeletonema_menzelii.AAC.7